MSNHKTNGYHTVDCPEARGIYPETEQPPEVRRAQSIGAVHAVLADLDRRWKIPPTEFCAEIASQIVARIAADPALMASLCRTWMSVVRGQALLDDLTEAGFTVRVEKRVLRVGPRDKMTKDVRDRINAGLADLLAVLGV